jgi:ABC-type transporter Mla subunit MlaD
VTTPEDAGAGGLNENQRRRLRVTCQHIDRLLSDIENILNASASLAAFPRYAADVAPEFRRSLENYIRRIRAQLQAALDTAGVTNQMPSISASRAIQTTLLYVEVAAEELAPRYMRGYGPLPGEAAEKLESIAENLATLVRQTQGVLEHNQKTA